MILQWGKSLWDTKAIREYYVSYFMGYKTQTKLKKLDIQDNTAYMEAEFTGEFSAVAPETLTAMLKDQDQTRL
jgi:hypothetical protein